MITFQSCTDLTRTKKKEKKEKKTQLKGLDFHQSCNKEKNIPVMAFFSYRCNLEISASQLLIIPAPYSTRVPLLTVAMMVNVPHNSLV